MGASLANPLIAAHRKAWSGRPIFQFAETGGRVSQRTLLEAAELVKMLEGKLGMTAAAPVAVAAMPAAAAAPAEPVEEKTEFTVVLKEVGEKKIEVIKVVRKPTNLGLKEAKDLVESAPATVVESVPKEVAESARAELEAVVRKTQKARERPARLLDLAGLSFTPSPDTTSGTRQ